MTTWRRCFSNFYPYERTVWLFVGRNPVFCAASTPEHFYQAHKPLDPNKRLAILAAPTPGVAKCIGRGVALRLDWQQIRIDVMRAALRAKFVPGTEAHRELIAHHGPIVEVNTWHDNFWGDCRCQRCRGIEGQNMLGRLLIGLRLELLS